MLALAVLRIHGARLEVLLGGLDGCAAELTAIGLSQRSDGHWEGPVQRLEPVCALLDRLGVIWGIYDRRGARTFGERLFAECPEEIAPDIYQALRSALTRIPSTGMHVAVLDAAWMSRGFLS